MERVMEPIGLMIKVDWVNYSCTMLCAETPRRHLIHARRLHTLISSVRLGVFFFLACSVGK